MDRTEEVQMGKRDRIEEVQRGKMNRTEEVQRGKMDRTEEAEMTSKTDSLRLPIFIIMTY